MRVKILVVLLAGLAVAVGADPVNDRVIKVTSSAKVESTRAKLVDYIWGASWASVISRQPNGVEHNYSPNAEDTVPSSLDNLQSIDRLDVSTSEKTKAGDTEAIPSYVFIFYPAKRSRQQAVIVHQGHGCTMTDTGDRGVHLEVAIRDLLTAGYVVAAMRMPLFQSPSDCGKTAMHNKLFEKPLQTGSPLQFFMEPIVKTVDYLSAYRSKDGAGLKEIDMIGLSGGGWTTTVYAAIDTRIVKSFPAAGTLPLYLRGEKYNHDLEQYYAPFYELAGYQDLYVMGAYGKGRSQLQILNRFDDCCFGEREHKISSPSYIEAVHEYERGVDQTLKKLGSGRFRVDIDESAHYHQVPKQAIEQEILPALAAGDH